MQVYLVHEAVEELGLVDDIRVQLAVQDLSDHRRLRDYYDLQQTYYSCSCLLNATPCLQNIFNQGLLLRQQSAVCNISHYGLWLLFFSCVITG